MSIQVIIGLCGSLFLLSFGVVSVVVSLFPEMCRRPHSALRWCYVICMFLLVSLALGITTRHSALLVLVFISLGMSMGPLCPSALRVMGIHSEEDKAVMWLLQVRWMVGLVRTFYSLCIVNFRLFVLACSP